MTTQHLRNRPFIKRVSHSTFLLLVLVVAAGCAQSPADTEPAVSSAPVQQKSEPSIATLANGSEIILELAITAEELATGLMFRPSLASDRGMLLLFHEERFPSIWMKNTLISLDLLYLDNSGRVVDLIADVPPCATDPCPTYSPDGEARAVLELATGSIETYGIAIGDQLLFERVPGYPVVEATAAPEADAAEEY